jgi:tRNA A-37 threonylcarbamoyl transferase component Bud32
MLKGLSYFFTKSTLLTDAQLETICARGKVVEQDERGPKVIVLDNGDFLKIFRARHFFSGARVYSHARRFYRNALRLEALNIPTVKIKSLHHLKVGGHTAVIYQPLAGEPIKDLVRSNNAQLRTTDKVLGEFLAKLHFNGVHFHSLHTGNILLLPSGEFGLIDISDMTIYAWPLACNTRLRSFKRLCKYAEDIQILGEDYWHKMLHAYFGKSVSSPMCKRKIMTFNPFLHA